MKKLLIVSLVGLLVGCGDTEFSNVQEFELKKLQMMQDHERELARINANPQHQQVTTYATQSSPPIEQAYDSSPVYDNQSSSSGSDDSGIGSTILAVGAGALAGYAVSELLDDGYRTYTDKSGRSVYVDKNGRQIDQRDYEAYKKSHPTKHKLSEYNKQGKSVVNTGATKTVEAAKKVDQKVVQPTKKAVQKKTSSFKSSSSKRK